MLESLINLGLGVVELAALIAIVAVIRRRLPDLRTVGATLLVITLAHLALLITPKLLHLHESWNWDGKVVSILVTLACIALIPSVNWSDAGFTWKQNGAIVPALIAVAVTCVIAWGSNLFFGGFQIKSPDLQAILFQATMPGLNEEPLYRGIALLLIDRAFGDEFTSLFGAPIGWGALITSIWFGIIHGAAIASGHFVFDLPTIIVVALIGFGLAWIRMRTGSLAFGVFTHNLTNVGQQFI